MSKRIDDIIEDIIEQYLQEDNNIPWIIGFTDKSLFDEIRKKGLTGIIQLKLI